MWRNQTRRRRARRRNRSKSPRERRSSGKRSCRACHEGARMRGPLDALCRRSPRPVPPRAPCAAQLGPRRPVGLLSSPHRLTPGTRLPAASPPLPPLSRGHQPAASPKHDRPPWERTAPALPRLHTTTQPWDGSPELPPASLCRTLDRKQTSRRTRRFAACVDSGMARGRPPTGSSVTSV